jgi:hypothetical protein
MAFPIGLAISGGTALLGGLFGGGKSTSNPYQGQIDDTTRRLMGAKGVYDQIAGNAGQMVSSVTPRFRSAFNGAVDKLSTDPYTDSYSAAKINQGLVGTEDAYQTAKARLSRSLQERGLAGSGIEAGGLADIEDARAGTLSMARNNLATQASDNSVQRALQLYGLTNDVRSQALQEQTGATGASAGIDERLLGLYSQLGQQQQELQQAQNNRLTGLLSGVGTAAGQFFGYGAGPRQGKGK